MKNIQKWFKVSAIFMIASISYPVSARFWFDIVPLEQILQNNPSIKYIQCTEKMPYEVASFKAEPLIPCKVVFDELFVLTIPNGRVQAKDGHVLIGDKFIKEFIWADRPEFLEDLERISDNQVKKVSGRVAVIAHKFYNYNSHFLHEALGRLVLLEINNIEYDWLYIPYETFFIKKFLELWGVDPKKIISPTDNNFCIQADELIVPSFVISKDVRFDHFGLNVHPYIMHYVKNKLIEVVHAKQITQQTFSEKVFVSRRDANQRKILNEDDVFALFEPLGFVRYELSKMSVEQQILLFQNAKIVIGEMGSGLTNILFCSPDTLVIELFQSVVDNSNWWIAENFGLRYFSIKTLNIDTSWVVNWRPYYWVYYQAGLSIINIPLDNIYPLVEMLKIFRICKT